MSSLWLKIIAIAAMTFDHVGAIFFPNVIIFRAIGRLTMPIMAFSIAEGYRHTRDVKAYFARLCVFAILSEIPFDMAFYSTPVYIQHQNIFFTLAFGLMAIYLVNMYRGNIVSSLAPMLCAILAQRLNTDYGYVGVFMVFGFYVFYEKPWGKIATMAAGAVALVLPNIGTLISMKNPGFEDIAWGFLQLVSILAIIPLSYYNGKRGYRGRYIFYVFYPLHLVALTLITWSLHI